MVEDNATCLFTAPSDRSIDAYDQAGATQQFDMRPWMDAVGFLKY